MLSMLRLLSVSVLAGAALFAAPMSKMDKDVIKFVKRGLGANPGITVYEVKILDRVPLDRPAGWTAYAVEFKLGLKKKNQERNITQSDILFVKDRYVAPDLVDIKTNGSLKRRIVLNFKESYYDDEHLIFGRKNAKHKIVVFSDPLCPFCREVVPKLFEAAKKHPDTFALYYYHLPIRAIHPASVPLAKAIIYLKKRGDKSAIEKIYKTPFDPTQSDESKILEELHKKLGIKLTSEQINRPDILSELHHDEELAEKLLVHGTPAVFVDGRFDRKREKYKQYLPKSER